MWQGEVEAWRIAQRAAGRAETTLRTRTDHLRWLQRWAGARGPWELTSDDLTAWLGRHTWKTNTRRSVLSTLRSFYRWGRLSGRTEDDPAERLPAVRQRPPAPHPTPETEYRRALHMAGPRERLMLRLAAECGMRRAEVARVHQRDLVEDLAGWSLVVHGKGDRERIVPLPASLARELRMLGGSWAFPGDDGGHLSAQWVGKLVCRLLPDGYSMHSLRHRFATRAYSISSDMFAVQELLGHASPATTRVYVQLQDGVKRRLVDAVADDPVDRLRSA